MSNAQPMTHRRRRAVYRRIHVNGEGLPLTARQRRQLDRMKRREDLRATGQLRHGASGLPVRKPTRRSRAARGTTS